MFRKLNTYTEGDLEFFMQLKRNSFQKLFSQESTKSHRRLSSFSKKPEICIFCAI